MTATASSVHHLQKDEANKKTPGVYPPRSVWRRRLLDFVFSQINLLQNDFQYFAGGRYGVDEVGSR